MFTFRRMPGKMFPKLLVNVSNSTVKNIFENGMIPKLIQKTAHHSVEYILWAN
jgi:hypothetical protein